MTATISLGKVVNVLAGQPAPKLTEFTDHGLPFIRAGSLEKLLSGMPEANCEKVDETAAQRNRLKLYPKGTVLFAKSGMSAKIGRIYQLRSPCYVVSHLAALAPTGEYDPSYLSFWLMRNPPSQLINDGAYPSIRTSEISSLQVPNIDLSEQCRISEILLKAEAIRHKREQALKLADAFLKSVFLEMFGDPSSNPKGWNEIPLGQLLERIDSGHSPRCHSHPAVDNELGVLKVSAISSTKFHPHKNKATFEGYKPKPLSLVRKGDLLFSRKNTYLLVGASAIVLEDVNNLILPDLIFRLVPSKEGGLQIPFLWGLLTQTSMRNRIRELAGGAAASMPNIGKARLKEMLIPVPDNNTQKKFTTVFSKHHDHIWKLRSDSEQAKSIFLALSQRAFAHKL